MGEDDFLGPVIGPNDVSLKAAKPLTRPLPRHHDLGVVDEIVDVIAAHRRPPLDHRFLPASLHGRIDADQSRRRTRVAPIRWFGVLSPPALRARGSIPEASLETAPCHRAGRNRSPPETPGACSRKAGARRLQLRTDSLPGPIAAFTSSSLCPPLTHINVGGLRAINITMRGGTQPATERVMAVFDFPAELRTAHNEVIRLSSSCLSSHQATSTV